MIKTILIVTLFIGYNGKGVSGYSQEFTSPSNCERAGKLLAKHPQGITGTLLRVRWSCVKK